DTYKSQFFTLSQEVYEDDTLSNELFSGRKWTRVTLVG
ncbi:unnamed protein product, partial [Allacma fusca]